MTIDPSPRDIHKLDQALVEAFADVDQLADNPLLRADLDEHGPAIAGAQWTDLLADRHTHMGLAGGYALATIRRIQERDRHAAEVERVSTERPYGQGPGAAAQPDAFQAAVKAAQRVIFGEDMGGEDVIAEALRAALVELRSVVAVRGMERVPDDSAARCGSRIAHESGVVLGCFGPAGHGALHATPDGGVCWTDDDDRVLVDSQSEGGVR